MRASLVGKLANTRLPLTRPLQPLFEAIANSFHAIEDAGPGKHKITISCVRGPALLDAASAPPSDFHIEDTGVGFTDQNTESFFTAESRHKASRGAKGNGRFLWLKAFERVEIDSQFKVPEGFARRTFVFTADDTLQPSPPTEPIQKHRFTKVSLLSMNPQLAGQLARPLDVLAELVVAHFLPFFRLEDCPRVVISDDGKPLDLNKLFLQEIVPLADASPFQVKGCAFTLTGYRLRRTQFRHNNLVLAANGREVRRDNLARYVQGLDRRVHDERDDTFTYLGFVEGDRLDELVSPDRLTFQDIEGSETGDLLGPYVGVDDIRQGAIEVVRRHLAQFLARVADEKADTVHRYVTQEAPEFRQLLAEDPDAVLNNLPTAPKPNEIQAALGTALVSRQLAIKEEGRKLLQNAPTADNIDAYSTRMTDYLSKLEQLNKTALAQYVIHRRVIIDLLDQALARDDETGKFQLEAAVHRLIHPMRTTSDEITFEKQNLWLLDERLTYHDFLTSDKPLTSITRLGSDSLQRPDILAVFDRRLTFADGGDTPHAFVIIEFKKPDRTNYSERGPLEQLLDVVHDIRAGNLKDRKGRPIEGAAREAPAFCYLVCDITEQVQRDALSRGGQLTPDARGYFGLISGLKAHFEVISYEKLVKDALRRNRVLFERLGLHTSRRSGE